MKAFVLIVWLIEGHPFGGAGITRIADFNDIHSCRQSGNAVVSSVKEQGGSVKYTCLPTPKGGQ